MLLSDCDKFTVANTPSLHAFNDTITFESLRCWLVCHRKVIHFPRGWGVFKCGGNTTSIESITLKWINLVLLVHKQLHNIIFDGF